MSHILRNLSYQEIWDGLAKEVEGGWINTKGDGHFILFDYNHKCQKEKYWNTFTMAARGLILNTDKQCIAALPFPKFFNFSEVPEHTIPQEPYTVYEKYDGSLGIIFYDGIEWRVTTRGSFTSEQAIFATKWLRENLGRFNLNIGNTYLAEIIYPSNRIVIDYGDFSGLIFLGGYNLESKEEISFQDVTDDINHLCRVYPNLNSLFDVVATAKALPGTSEGYVVRFNGGYRLKVKSDDYNRLHRIVTGINPTRIWDALCNGQLITDWIPEEHQQYWISVQQEMLQEYNKKEDLLRKAMTQIDTLSSRKEQALLIQEILPKALWSAAFNMLDSDLEQVKRSIWKTIQP